MSRHDKAARALALAALSLTALALGGGANAGAAACPNEAIRVEQGSTALPDCRAWEMVSARDKNQNKVVEGATVLSADGNRVMYTIYGGTSGSTTGSRPKFLSTRTPGGWVTSNPMPSNLEMPGNTYTIFATAPDLTGWVASSFEGLGTNDESPEMSLLRLTDSGSQTLLHTFPVQFGAAGAGGVASDDLSRVYADVPEAIDPSHQAGTANVYDFGSGTPQLISRLPGTGQAPSCGVRDDSSSFVTKETTASPRWISSDGSRVFFLTRGDDAPACTAPLQLYQRDRGTEATTRISASPTGAGPDLGAESFLQGAEDGSWAFFETATSYAADDDADGDSADRDVYKWADGGGLDCVTCVVPGAQVRPTQLAALSYGAAVSADGSHVYFASAAKLADAPSAATEFEPNLYVLSGGTVHFIAMLGPADRVTATPVAGGDLTPDGDVFVFRSDAAGLNAATASDNGGLAQYYRYGDDDRTLACMSCPPDEVPASFAVPPEALLTSGLSVPPDMRAITDDGERAYFMSANALVAADENGKPDVYEWHAGAPHLISDGKFSAYLERSKLELVGTSADGRDVFFTTPAYLTFDADDDAAKLYDARVDGGFAAPPAPAPPCSEGACFGPPAPRPSALPPGSDAGAGEGNVRSKPHRKKHHHKGKGHKKQPRPRHSHHRHGGSK